MSDFSGLPSGTEMVHELKRQMCSKMTEWPGILAAVISDTDGVPILQAVLEPDDVDNKSNSAEPFTRYVPKLQMVLLG